MNKKYLSVFLFSALLAGTAGTFTSCKDYDDDIESLQGQIDSQGTSLESELSTINSSISSLQSAQSSLEAALSAAESAAEAAALQAQITAIETAAAELEEVRATLQAAIDANTTAVEEISAIVTEVETTMAEVVGRIQALESFVTTTESALADLQTAQATLESSITTLSESVQATLAEHGQRLTALEAQMAALEAYMNDDIGVQIDDIMSQLSGLNSLSEAIANVDKLLAAYQASNDAALANTDSIVADLKSQLEAAQAELAAAGTSISGLDSQVAALEAALEALQEGQLSQADLDAITEQITESVSSQLEELSATITEKVNADLDLLSQVLSTQVTHVSLYITTSKDYEYLNLVSAEAVRTWTFGEGLAGSPVSFTLGDRETFEDNFLLRVSPTTATLDKSKIKLVNSNMESLEGLVEIESIEPYTSLVTTRATSANGLWQVNVKLVDNYDSDAYNKAAAVTSNNVTEQILYAVMVGDSTTGERQVVSEYGIVLTQQNKTLVSKLNFNVDNTSVNEIHNRWSGSVPTITENGGENYYQELTWFTIVDANGNAISGPHAEPITEGNTINVKADDTDARNIEPAYSVDVNQKFTVSLNAADTTNIRAFYVTLDSDCAVESAPSELNAWQSYTIEGLNTVTDKSSIDLTITSSSANGDYIGFRVYAVNYDGSLVDPDGKAFYVYVGQTAQTQANLVLSMESEIVVPLLTTIESNTDAFSTTGWDNAQSYELVITDANGNDVTSDINITMNNLVFYNDKNQVVDMSGSSKGTATSVKLTNVDPSELKDGMTYTITITAKNATSGNVAKGTITFTKEMPSFPTSVYPFTGQLVSGNLKVYPYYDGTYAVYNMQSSWHGLVDDNGTAWDNLDLYQVTSSNQTATVSYDKSITSVSAPASVVSPSNSAYGTKYSMEFSYNYGPISYRLNSANQYAVQDWLTYYGGFTLQLGNYVDDCTYEMASNISVSYPGGVGQESEIRLSYITVTDWYGYTIDLSEIGNGDTSTNEGKYFDEVESGVPFKVEFITTNEAGKEIVDEYYTFKGIETRGTGSSAYDVIVMVSKSDAAVGTGVETSIRLTFKDKFGNEIVKDVEGSFTMSFQQ